MRGCRELKHWTPFPESCTLCKRATEWLCTYSLGTLGIHLPEAVLRVVVLATRALVPLEELDDALDHGVLEKFLHDKDDYLQQVEVTSSQTRKADIKDGLVDLQEIRRLCSSNCFEHGYLRGQF